MFKKPKYVCNETLAFGSLPKTKPKNENDLTVFCSLEGAHLHLYIEYVGLTFVFVILIFQHSVQHKIAYCPLLVRLGCGATATEPFGFWEIYGLGLITLYKSDWDKIGGMNVKEFKDKWGGEDWEFVDRLLEAGMEVETIKMMHFFHHYHSKKGMWNNI